VLKSRRHASIRCVRTPPGPIPHTTPKWTVAGVLCIKTNQVRAGKLDLSSPHFVSEETYRTRIERLEPRCDDILYIREGGVRGVGCRIPSNTQLCLGQRLMLIRANESVVPAFLELSINSPWITDFAEEKTTGGAAPRVNMSVVRAYPIPIPPLAEQHRIVAKVDELMALCGLYTVEAIAGRRTVSKLMRAARALARNR
jgi:type I restriction enzyme, S subunit